MIYTEKDFSFAHLFLGVRDEKSHPAFLPPNRHANQFGPPPKKGQFPCCFRPYDMLFSLHEFSSESYNNFS